MKFSWERRCISSASSVFKLDALMVAEVKEVNHLISSRKGGRFVVVNHSVLRIEKKFSALALSYRFPFLDMDGGMPYA